MTGKQTTPHAVDGTIFSNSFLTGPLAWMIDAQSDSFALNSPIRAIWRNEAGTAQAPEHHINRQATS